MEDRHTRLLRAAVVTIVVLALSAGAHLGGGGTLPHSFFLLGLAALTMLSATIVAKRTLGLPALLAVLGGGQFALHHAFGFLTGIIAVCAPASTEHDHEALHACTVVPVESSFHALDAGAGLPMFAAHAIATLATALLITRGEGALHAVARWMRPLFMVPRAAPLFPPARVITDARDSPRHAAPFLVSPPLRGPPAFR
jgi:hypothetical protein